MKCATADDTLPEAIERFLVSIALVSAPAYVVLDPNQPLQTVGDILDNDGGSSPLMAPPDPSPPIDSEILIAVPSDDSAEILASEDGTEAAATTNPESDPNATPDSTTSDAAIAADADNSDLELDGLADSVSTLPPSSAADLLVESNSTPDATDNLVTSADATFDPTVAGQYPTDDAAAATTETATNTTAVGQIGDQLFAVGTSETDLMESLLLNSDSSAAFETAPPGSGAELGENAQLQITADGSVAIGSLS